MPGPKAWSRLGFLGHFRFRPPRGGLFRRCSPEESRPCVRGMAPVQWRNGQQVDDRVHAHGHEPKVYGLGDPGRQLESHGQAVRGGCGSQATDRSGQHDSQPPARGTLLHGCFHFRESIPRPYPDANDSHAEEPRGQDVTALMDQNSQGGGAEAENGPGHLAVYEKGQRRHRTGDVQGPIRPNAIRFHGVLRFLHVCKMTGVARRSVSSAAVPCP